MNRFLLPAAIAASLFLAACGSTGEVAEPASAGSDAKAQYEQAIKQAESSYKEVAQMGGAWSQTEDKINEAKKAAEANEFDKALKLAKEAQDQSLLAKQQFEGEKNAGPHLF